MKEFCQFVTELVQSLSKEVSDAQEEARKYDPGAEKDAMHSKALGLERAAGIVAQHAREKGYLN